MKTRKYKVWIADTQNYEEGEDYIVEATSKGGAIAKAFFEFENSGHVRDEWGYMAVVKIQPIELIQEDLN